MLNPALLKQDSPDLWQALERRGEKLDRKKLLAQRDALTQMRSTESQLREEKNRLSAEIGRSKGGDNSALREQASQVAARLRALAGETEQAEQHWRTACLWLPNLPDESVPDGLTEEHNRVLAVYDGKGEAAALDWQPEMAKGGAVDHQEIAQQLAMYDTDAASAMSGARFSVLSGPLARLHRILGQFFIDLQTQERGYTEYWVPWLLRPPAVEGAGQLPKFADDLFAAGEQHYLLSTGEVPLVNICAGRIVQSDELPMKFCTLTPCFRSEAGSYGRDTRGLIRQHQFEKVEIVQLTAAEKSSETLEQMVQDARQPLLRLGLPHRLVELCAGELSFASARTLDIEVWMPGQQQWREISSCSNCRDFQARRLQIRHRTGSDKPELVHTLNGSALPLGRCLAAVLENGWDGNRLQLPPALSEAFAATEFSAKDAARD